MDTAFKAFTSIWTFACAVWVIAASEACAPPTKEGLDCGIDRGDATAESGGSEPSAGPAFANAILHHVRLRLQQIRQGTLVLLSSADATRYDVGRLPRQPSGGQPSGGQSVEGLRGVGR
jgi:hypothetical protein